MVPIVVPLSVRPTEKYAEIFLPRNLAQEEKPITIPIAEGISLVLPADAKLERTETSLEKLPEDHWRRAAHLVSKGLHPSVRLTYIRNGTDPNTGFLVAKLTPEASGTPQEVLEKEFEAYGRELNGVLTRYIQAEVDLSTVSSGGIQILAKNFRLTEPPPAGFEAAGSGVLETEYFDKDEIVFHQLCTVLLVKDSSGGRSVIIYGPVAGDRIDEKSSLPLRGTTGVRAAARQVVDPARIEIKPASSQHANGIQ